MNPYSEIAEDFYINMQLQTAMDLPQQRDALVHFFEQVQRRYPRMRNLITREKEVFLEEDKDQGNYRWSSVELRRICSGFVNPVSFDEALQLHRDMLEIAPYSLSLSHLDCESLNVVYGFDFTYRGNHNQLLAETLGLPPSLDSFLDIPGAQCLGYEPCIQLTLDPEMRTQCRLSFETRSIPYSMRTGEFPEEQLSVYLAIRRVDSLLPNEKFVDEVARLATLGKNILDEYILDNILRPLHQAIAIQ